MGGMCAPLPPETRPAAEWCYQSSEAYIRHMACPRAFEWRNQVSFEPRCPAGRERFSNRSLDSCGASRAQATQEKVLHPNLALFAFVFATLQQNGHAQLMYVPLSFK
jgi:hypothetical protein